MVVPGIMGTELVDSVSNAPLWGSLGSYLNAWVTGDPLTVLRVDPAERDGRAGRIVPTRLLSAPAWAPVFRGVEPYRALLDAVRHVLVAPEALLPFPYDWRLSVRHNAKLLLDAAYRHLQAWREHPEAGDDAKVILVAHSMGGLLAHHMAGPLGGTEFVRRTVALGTPYHGAVKAAVVLNTGRGCRFPCRPDDCATSRPRCPASMTSCRPIAVSSPTAVPDG